MTNRGPREFWYDHRESSWRGHAPDQASSPSAEDVYFGGDDPEPFCSVEQLHDALKSLTARQRFVIELRYGMKDGYVYDRGEIAEMTSWSIATIREHEEQAMQKIYKVHTGEVRRNTPQPRSTTCQGKDGGNVSDTERAPHL